MPIRFSVAVPLCFIYWTLKRLGIRRSQTPSNNNNIKIGNTEASSLNFAERTDNVVLSSTDGLVVCRTWRNALTEAATLAGWDLSSFNDDAMLIKRIVEDVSHKLSPPVKNIKVITILERLLPISNVILEILSAVFEQLSSSDKSYFALTGILVSILALIICIVELIYKGRRAGVKWKTNGVSRIITMGWFYHPPPHGHKPFGSITDVIGLMFAVAQLISTVLQYVYLLRHTGFPVQFSLPPIIFAVCLVGSSFVKNYGVEHNLRPVQDL